MKTVCGIAGVVGEVELEHRAQVRSMCDAMRHRGPDDEGYFDHDGVCLGMRRLSIIDVDHGSQPVQSEDGAVQVVFNGEIYNYVQLQDQLRARGHRLASESDSECIPHLFEDRGADFIQGLRGMFALAVWDSRRAELLLARDRVGKKPLFYWEHGGRLWFASELKCLLGIPTLKRDIDPAALDCYLTYQYVPAPLSIIAGVRKLPPAHRLNWRGGATRISRYWHLEYAQTGQKKPVDEKASESELRSQLLESTRLRMVSERPLGAFLSGGLDSSAIVAAMSMVSPKPVATYSIGFEESAYNELPFARRVAELFGTDHHEQVIQPTIDEILPEIARMFDEPFADSSAVPTYYVAEMARQDVVVVLNGDGGDESLGGYSRYSNFLRFANSVRLPTILGSLGGPLGALVQRHPSRFNMVNRAGSMALRRLASEPAERYGRMVSYFTPEERRALYGDQLRAEGQPSYAYEFEKEVWRTHASADTVNKLLAADVGLYLPGALLPKVDITSMAVSLEVRSPMLDHRFMEWAARLPGDLKVRNGQTKYLLKRAMEPWLPPDIVHRTKAGFALPLVQWLKGPLRPMVHDLILMHGSRTSSYLQTKEVQRIVRGFDRTGHGAPTIWSLLMLELWHRTVQEGR